MRKIKKQGKREEKNIGNVDIVALRADTKHRRRKFIQYLRGDENRKKAICCGDGHFISDILGGVERAPASIRSKSL